MSEGRSLEDAFKEFLDTFDIVAIDLSGHLAHYKGYIVPDFYVVLVKRNMSLEELYRTIIHEFFHYEFPQLSEAQIEQLAQSYEDKFWSILEAEVGVPAWMIKQNDEFSNSTERGSGERE